jgi:polysaccharide export outer membrane protein
LEVKKMYRSSIIAFALVALMNISLTLGCATTPPGPELQIIKAEELSGSPTPLPPPPQLILPPTGVKHGDTETFEAPKYILGPGDVLEISIWVRLIEQKYIVPVSEEGTVTFTYIDNVQVSGLTIGEARELLLKELSKYIKEPKVNIFVKEYQSKRVSLLGEIKGGHYPLTGRTSVLDLVIKAGADLATADLKSIRVMRRGKTYRLNLYRTIFQEDESQNIVLEDNDVVIVDGLSSPANQVHVLGEVTKPGAYDYQYKMNLVSAIAQAGGLTDVAVTDNLVVIRGGFENPTLIASNMKQFFEKADLSQNIYLQGGDVVYVPRTLLGDIEIFTRKLLPVLYLGRIPAEYWHMYKGEFLLSPSDYR